MKTPIETFVITNLDDSQRMEIVLGWEKFNKDGFIGEEPLRIHARHLSTLQGQTNDTYIIMWMRELAMEVFRYYAMEYIRDNGLDNT